MFTELYRKEKREEGDRGGQEVYKRGESKGERQIQPVISSLSVLHLGNTQRFTELGREKKGERGDRGDLVEKKESLYDPAIQLLGIHTEEIRTERDTGTPMFIAALFTIARI